MSAGRIREAFESWLQQGGERIGQVLIRGRYELRHVDDSGRDDLEEFQGPAAARAIARENAAGAFRPLKTAPDLRRGWLLRVGTPVELELALGYFYPAMIGIWARYQEGRVRPVTLRETLGRQTGMYAAGRKITDAEADGLIGEFCRCDTRCLKKILWQIADGRPIGSLPTSDLDPEKAEGLPLICHEACNLLVAACREWVKGSR